MTAVLVEPSPRSLRRSLVAGSGSRRRAAVLLVLPLLVFLLALFVLPIGYLLWNAVDEAPVAGGLSRTVQALRGWDGRSQPADAVFDAP